MYYGMIRGKYYIDHGELQEARSCYIDLSLDLSTREVYMAIRDMVAI